MTVEKFDILNDLISKIVLNKQKKISNEKWCKLGQDIEKHELEKQKAKERRKQSHNKIKEAEKHDMEKVNTRKTRKCHNQRKQETHD